MKHYVTIIIVAIFVIGVVISIEQVVSSNSRAPMAKEEVESFILNKYSGEVKNIKAVNNEQYEVLIERNTGIYEIIVSAEEHRIVNISTIELKDKLINEKQAKDIALKDIEGKIDDVKLIQDEEAPIYKIKVTTETGNTVLTIRADSGEITDRLVQDKASSPNEQTENTLITQEEAKQLALSKVKGTLDEIELTDFNGVPYYEVDIDINDDDEATVFVHAYTGETTITYED